MRGRVTFKDGRHPSRVADWIDPADDVPDNLAELVAVHRYFRRCYSSDRVPARDIRATLEAMSRIDDDEAAATALDWCDSATHALLRIPLRRTFGNTLSARLRASSAAALRTFPALSKPAKGYQVMLARALLEAWEQQTGEAVPAVWGDTVSHCSPIVGFAHRVFVLVEQKPFDVKRVVRLLDGALSTP